MSITIPGGREKGTPVADAADGTLRYWAEKGRDDVLRDACAQELERRSMSGEPPREAPARRSSPPSEPRAQQPSCALATRPSDALAAGPTHDPSAVTARLQDSASRYHLVSPAASCDMLPPGCGVAMSLVRVDAQKDHKEVYSVGGRLGLGENALKRIGAAAGLSWDVDRCGRLDDGRDPHYVHYRAVGRVRNFDGSERVVSGEVEMDMREGSPQVEEIRSKASGRERDDGGESQLREIRKFILRHAETKAKNRAIADMGVKRSYAPAELNKPFAVARLMWTGQTDDPELRRTFAVMHAQQMIGGNAALYGGGAPQLPKRPAPRQFVGHEAPPVGSIGYDGGGDPGGYDVDAAGGEEGEY